MGKYLEKAVPSTFFQGPLENLFKMALPRRPEAPVMTTVQFSIAKDSLHEKLHVFVYKFILLRNDLAVEVDSVCESINSEFSAQLSRVKISCFR